MLLVFGLCCWHLIGVFGVDEVKLVMEGDSVTLNTDLTEIHEDEDILWRFGAKTLLIAEIRKADGVFSTHDEVPDGRFRDRLKLDHQTGSLTIRNITTEHTGDYKLQRSGVKWSTRTFSVSVHARLPVPIITRDSSSPSSSSSDQNCSVLCSVVNVSHVTLSWYKGNSSLSSISVSDINGNVSLDVNYQDTNTYICVVNNSLSNQTKHLNITQLCRSSLNQSLPLFLITLISAAAGSLLVVVALLTCCICKKRRKTVEAQEEDGAHSALRKPKTQKTKLKEEALYQNVPQKR